ncbi:MAG TPA: MFS transporter [Noviherbaspirillum sp.]|nr:MFS transporter [Noviherbaspirillum sp.]
MSPTEIRSSASLASIFALRMLGMFLILPVFSVHAQSLPGGESATLVGLAMGIYGLTQSFGQIPFGAASDKYGRKRIIIIGLLLFALGSFIAAAATDLVWVIVGRAIQGAGAISAAVTAFIADSTREEHRTKAMAMVGGSIGLTFAVSLIAAPVMYKLIGMGGIFALTGILSLIAILVVAYVVPPAPKAPVTQRVPFSVILANGELMRMNYGVFALHMTQMAMFVVMPGALVEYVGLPLSAHWKVYLPIVLASFALMLPPVFAGERRGMMKSVFLGAIALMLAVQLGLWLFLSSPTHWVILLGLLLAFFVSFNILEASQPSLVSRIAPPAAKGAALGVYNTLQALGLFCGGAIGGWLQQHVGRSAVFALGAALTLVWIVVAANMKNMPRRGTVSQVA